MLTVIDGLFGDGVRSRAAPEVGAGFEEIHFVTGRAQGGGGGEAGEPPSNNGDMTH